MSVEMIPIVEGHGEVRSVPIILRRLAAEVELYQVRIASPIRIPRDRFVREGEAERAVELAARHLGGAGGIVIVMDADDDLPCELGPRLLARASARRSDVPIAVILAKCELEAWFLASIESLRGQRGVRESAAAPSDPESIRGAKGMLSRLMSGRYSEVTDQAAFAAKFDLEVARGRSPSFSKLSRDIHKMIEKLRNRPSP